MTQSQARALGPESPWRAIGKMRTPRLKNLEIDVHWSQKITSIQEGLSMC
jgi:hypothetical protein